MHLKNTTLFLLLISILPVILHAQYFSDAQKFGAGGEEIISDIHIDGSGNIYLAGTFTNTVDFDAGPNLEERTATQGTDLFVLKLDSARNFQWVMTTEGAFDMIVNDLHVDNNGNILITGGFNGVTDFDPSTSVSQVIGWAANDIYVCKLNSNGTLAWAQAFGDYAHDNGLGIGSDADGNVYTVGNFNGTIDFNAGTGVDTLKFMGANDVFIQKLAPNGDFIWVKQIGSPSLVDVFGFTMDENDNLFISGNFRVPTDFDPGPAQFLMSTHDGNSSGFLTKLDSSGAFQWAVVTGQYPMAVSTDLHGNAHISGYFYDSLDFDPGNGKSMLTSSGVTDAFCTKYNADGELIWARHTGSSSGYIMGTSLDIDSRGHVYLTGRIEAPGDLDPGAEVFSPFLLSSAGGNDVFISVLDSSGSFLWANNFGTMGFAHPNAIAVADTGNVYLSGTFQDSAIIDTGNTANNILAAGQSDGYLIKISGLETVSKLEHITAINYSVFPNPSQGIINIDLKKVDSNVEVLLMDMNGKIILRETFTSSHQIQLELPIQSGLYFLKVNDKNQNKTLGSKVILRK